MSEESREELIRREFDRWNGRHPRPLARRSGLRGREPEGAVIGGTGAYAGATGDFTEAEEGEGLTRYSLEIQVPE